MSLPSSDALSLTSSTKELGGSGTGESLKGLYSNDLFDASGGAKKKGPGGYMEKIMMSSEEKRRQKVKESITVVGAKKVRATREKGLVKI